MLTLRLPSAGFDQTHRRHFIEALAVTPGVRIVPQDSREIADVDIETGFHAHIKARIYHNDPHALAFDCGGTIAPFLWAPEVDLLEKAGYGHRREHITSADGWAAAIVRGNPTSQVERLDAFDLVLAPMRDPYDVALAPKLEHAKLLRVPLSVPSRIFHPAALDGRFLDVFFLGAVCEYYPLRTIMLKALLAERGEPLMPRSALKTYVGEGPTKEEWAAFREAPALFDEHQRWYAECLRNAKITAFGPGVGGYPVQKYYEAMACGCLVIAPLPRDAELLGFVDGETMVAVGADDFMDKIRRYAEDDAERRRITGNAAALVAANHTCEARARILMEQLTAIRDGASVEDVDAWGLR